jgi:signal transduction histidine kinase/CheY-like chemotaxis protein
MDFWLKALHNYGRRGLTEGLAPDLFRCLFATNMACLFHLCTTLPYVILFAFFGSKLLLGMTLVLCSAYPVSMWLMKHQKYTAARFILLSAITSAIFTFCLFLGEASRLETTLLYTVAAPAIFFSTREIRNMALAITLPCLAYTILHTVGYGWFAPYPLTPMQIDLFRVMITATTAILILLPIILLLRSQVSTEQALIQAKEKAEFSDRAKSDFLTTVSHELRTPLNGLLGTLELLNGEPLSPEQSENLAVARSSGDLLRNVIADILDFSRFEKGMVLLENRPHDLVEVVRRSLAAFKVPAQEKGLALHFVIQGEFTWVMADASRLQQVVVNLVGNALKFTDRGSITVRLIAHSNSDAKLHCELEVEDTGIGIPLEKQTDLFEPFTQAHRSLRTDIVGCGLGLAICHRLATVMGGALTLKSEVGQGSLFRFSLVLPIHVMAPSEKPTTRDSTQVLGSNPEIRGDFLIVEDVAINRLVAVKFLKRLGIKADIAVNGVEAVEAYHNHPYQWILMDCQMPVMDGYEATREIRKLGASQKNHSAPFIIALTANAHEHDREKCFAVGMDAFLEKPLSIEALQETIQRLSKNRETLTEV